MCELGCRAREESLFRTNVDTRAGAEQEGDSIRGRGDGAGGHLGVGIGVLLSDHGLELERELRNLGLQLLVARRRGRHTPNLLNEGKFGMHTARQPEVRCDR